MTTDQLYKDFVSAYDAWRDKGAKLHDVDAARDAIADAETPPQLVPANIESFLAGMNRAYAAQLRPAGGGANG